MYALLARSAERAVVFRRGPSKQVLLLTWNTATDEFEEGQWLKGRIYERRCDLSPNGELLLYFAATHRMPYLSWSALSRPPYLTALALWPKGDAWGGGGLFETGNRIALNHGETESTLAEGYSLPKDFNVHPFGARPGWGEDDPVWSARLERDGWTRASSGRLTERDVGWKVMFPFAPPIVWEKRNPHAPNRYTLQMTIRGINEENGSWYVIEHQVLEDGAESHRLGRTDWADWCHSGDLLFSKQSSLYRVRCPGGVLAPLSEARALINVDGATFTEREAPPQARRWPGANATRSPQPPRSK